MFHLIATFAAALCAAGGILLAYRVFGRKPPKYLVPMAAGIAMLGYNVWHEYSWYSRTVSGFPPHLKVVSSVAEATYWQPWTYLFPRTERLIAVDLSRTRRNDRFPDLVIAEVILAKRMGDTLVTHQLFDCAGHRHTDVTPNTSFGDDGLPADAAWYVMEPADPLLATVCGAT